MTIPTRRTGSIRVIFLILLAGWSASTTWAAVPTGYPNKGTLQEGIDLFQLIREHSDILESVSPEEYQYGTSQMAETILTIGNWAKTLGRQPVWIGDVSKKGGGNLARHQTHQRGLDADIAYLVYLHKKTGGRFKSYHDRFTEQFGLKQGKLENNFDLKSNYELLKKIVGTLDVESIFVGCGIYDALETFDKTQPSSIMDLIYAQKGHENHFHLRLKCPSGNQDCHNEWWTDPTKSQKPKSKSSLPRSKFRDC